MPYCLLPNTSYIVLYRLRAYTRILRSLGYHGAMETLSTQAKCRLDLARKWNFRHASVGRAEQMQICQQQELLYEGLFVGYFRTMMFPGEF